jgi:hypothetical protein
MKYIQYSLTTGATTACNYFETDPSSLPPDTGQMAVDDLFDPNDCGTPASTVLVKGTFWPISINASQIIIGCQTYDIAQWAAFTDDQITAMHPEALTWWTDNKTWLLALANLWASQNT